MGDWHGKHLVIEYHGCDPSVLGDPTTLEAVARASASATSTAVHECVLHGEPGGGALELVLVLARGHLAIHTWPERGYAAVDVLLPGETDADPERAHEVLREALGATHSERMLVRRGGRLMLRRIAGTPAGDHAPAEARRSEYPPVGAGGDTET